MSAKPFSNMAFFHTRDQVGSDRIETNASGAVTLDRTSLPFGDATTAVSGGRDNSFDGFTGFWDGGSSATNHAQFREYSNLAGRWLQPDPYSGSYDLSNPQSFNRYAYALNNPVAFVDPSGLLSCYYGDPADDPSTDDDPTDFADVSSADECSGGGGLLLGTSDSVTVSADPTDVVVDINQDQPGLYVIPTVTNPCAFMGTAKTPAQYATAGKQYASSHPNTSTASFIFNGAPDLYSQFHRGAPLDAQTKANGSGLQKAAYGNYAYGVFFAAAGFSLSDTLAFASAYGYKQQVINGSYKGRSFNPHIGGIPAANVQNIVAGYSAQLNGTACH